MNQKESTVQLRILEAAPGHWLHRKEEPESEAYFTHRVYLGIHDSPDNYTEITDERYAAIMEERKRAEEPEATDDSEINL